MGVGVLVEWGVGICILLAAFYICPGVLMQLMSNRRAGLVVAHP